jgi:uncharacterized protein DUF6717
MSGKISVRRIALAATAVVALGGIVVWFSGVLPVRRGKPPQNAINVIAPYRANGTWVFDDERYGLVREPFVAGVPEMIDALVADIPRATQGFRLTFSANPFPTYQKKLVWLRGGTQGNYYRLDDPPMEGWICPALFRYYEKPPAELYVRADAIAD